MDESKREKLFRDIESKRYRKATKLRQRIDSLFDAYLMEVGLIMDQYKSLCKGVTNYRQRVGKLTAKEMGKCRNHFKDRLNQSMSSPIGWPESVVKRLKSASAKGLFTRLELLSLELSCASLALYDRIWELESESFGEAAEDGYAYTLWAWHVLSGQSGAYEPLTPEEMDALLLESGRPKGGFVWVKSGDSNAYDSEMDAGITNGLASNLRHAALDLSNTVEREAKINVMRDRVEDIKTEIDKRSRSKRNSAKGGAATDHTLHSSSGQMEAFRRAGVKRVIIDNPMDERTTEICRRMYGTVLYLGECVPGVTAPPFHYNCRSILLPYSVGPEGDGFDESYRKWTAGGKEE